MTTPSEYPESHGGDPDGYGSAYGNQSTPGHAYGSQPFGSDPYGTQPYGSQPYGTQPVGSDPYGTQPYGSDPYGSRPYGEFSYGQQPYAGQPFGVQPYGSPGYGAMHPYAPNYGASRKEPALSLVLSFFLPGLGTLINGQAGKGIGIMAGYFLGILLSVVLIGIPIMLGFWVWGMVDAYSGAKEYNARNGFY